MSGERIIQAADLSFILGALRGLEKDIGQVGTLVDSVGQNLNQTRSELNRLEKAFADFIMADLRAKELALAETRQVKIRQELDTTYGYYAQVRRHAEGILQASDSQLVRRDTLRAVTEELMMQTPRYWLAPALVALGAWIADNQPLATRALAEALRRDDEKTSLFFVLVCRRAQREGPMLTWLDRYLGLQNPHMLDRQTMVLIDAVANGVLGTQASMQSTQRINAWVHELSQAAGFIDAQREQWSRALLSKMPRGDHAPQYPHLSRYSPDWARLEQSLNEVSLYATVLNYLKSVFDGAVSAPISLQVAVDDLLVKLVSRYDDEELPLRRQEAMCRLIIEEAGDKPAAQKRYDLEEKALDEVVDFTQMLTNAGMHPELSGASRATQRFAIAHSRDWMLQAHEDITARHRMQAPGDIPIRIEDWVGQTRDGSNEKPLQADLLAHLSRREADALAPLKLGGKHWLALIVGVMLVLASLSAGWFVLVLAVGALGWVALGWHQIRQARAKLKADYARLKEQSVHALKACLAEVVEWRRDWTRRDAVAGELSNYLSQISPDQHLLSSHQPVRRVMAGG